MSIIAFLAAAAAATATPSELKAFTDWIVGCDNGRACKAVGLLPEDFAEGWSTIAVTRGPEANAAPRVRIQSDTEAGVTLVADGKRLAVRLSRNGPEISIAAADQPVLLGAMKAAKTLELVDARGKPIVAYSLAGLSAALLYMDDRQKRVGTVTALVRKGTRPASAVPAPPAIPTIVSPATPKLAPRTLSRAQVGQVLTPLGCDLDGENAFGPPEHHRLDARTSLALVPWPCMNGAYNLFAYAVLIDQRGGTRPASFEVGGGMSDDNDNSLVNADWDAATRRLRTYAKGRGLGDCGTVSSFAWDGVRFRLAEQAQMGECRGSVDYITTWRATVRRR
jgi:hypothetical protein